MVRLPQAGRSATRSSAPYCPQQYDIVAISFDPQSGREQALRRPAFVLTPGKYNQITRLCVLCPITNQAKGYPFEVTVPAGGRTSGVILADQIKSFDWDARDAAFVESRPELAGEVVGKIRALLQI